MIAVAHVQMMGSKKCIKENHKNKASKYDINAHLLIDAQREEHRALNR